MFPADGDRADAGATIGCHRRGSRCCCVRPVHPSRRIASPASLHSRHRLVRHRRVHCAVVWRNSSDTPFRYPPDCIGRTFDNRKGTAWWRFRSVRRCDWRAPRQSMRGAAKTRVSSAPNSHTADATHGHGELTSDGLLPCAQLAARVRRRSATGDRDPVSVLLVRQMK